MATAEADTLFAHMRLGDDDADRRAAARAAEQAEHGLQRGDPEAQLERRLRISELLWQVEERRFVARMQEAPPMQMRDLLRGAIFEKLKIEAQCLEARAPPSRAASCRCACARTSGAARRSASSPATTGSRSPRGTACRGARQTPWRRCTA